MILALQWLSKHWRDAILIGLIILLVIQTKTKNNLRDELNQTQNTIDLKEGELAKVILENNQLRAAGPVNNGSGTPVYIPVESPIIITLKENVKFQKQLSELNKRILELQNDPTKAEELKQALAERDTLLKQIYSLQLEYNLKGFTFRPGMGILYSGKFLIEVDAKIFYWSRYSAKVGLTKEFVTGGISRHVDDLIPFVKVRNLEAQLVGGLGYDGDFRVAFGTRINW